MRCRPRQLLIRLLCECIRTGQCSHLQESETEEANKHVLWHLLQLEADD